MTAIARPWSWTISIGCSSGSDGAAASRPSPNQAPRPAGTVVDTLVLHYTGMADGAAARQRLCDPAAGVSAHWLVEADGRLIPLVGEDRVAWHAGVSAWRGRSGLNAHSIGIEIVNGGHDFGLPPYPEPQLAAVVDLARAIVARWRIPATHVVGHADVAPMRKRDPGERFPWARLAAAGVGLWPPPRADDPAVDVSAALATIGYAVEGAPQPTSVSAVLAAFQRRFMPARPADGRADAATRARLKEVAAAYLLARPASAP